MSIAERNLPATSAPNTGLTMVVDFTLLKQRIAQLRQFVAEYMVPGEDFGVIEGTGSKPTLLKPGAEKLCDVYGLSAGEAQIEFTRDDTKSPTYIAYRVSLPLVSRADGRIIMVGVGSANSWEKKYRWRWVFDNELPAGMSPEGLRTKTGTSKKGKDWTQYRVPNDEIDDIDNTLLKMAKKRALIDAVLSATRSSALFTQDVEDMDLTVRQADTSERDERRQSQPPQGNRSQSPGGNGQRMNSNPASDKQKGAIRNMGKQHGLEGPALDALVSGLTGKTSLDELTVSEASQIITELNNYKPGGGGQGAQDDGLPNDDDLPF